MRVVDLGGVPIEEFASYRARFPEVAEALERLESTLEEIDKIEQQNIQKREERIASNKELSAHLDAAFKALTRSLLEL